MKGPFYRFATHWKRKLLLTLLLNAIFWFGYGYLARNAFFRTTTLPLTWFDELIPFNPAFALPYLSIYILTFVIPWSIMEPEHLRRYTVGLLFLSATSFLIFFLFPVASPRPDEIPHKFFYDLVLKMDGTLNAFPSLHAGFLLYTLGLGCVLFADKLSWFRCLFFGFWGMLILYATIATRQHYFLDLLAGGILGYCAHLLAWGSAARAHVALAKIFRNKPVQSQRG
jgi:membrane-associated phospholipid phosphatase